MEELIACIAANRTFVFQFENGNNNVSAEKSSFEKKLYSLHNSNPYEALFYLGTAPKTVIFSTSIDFFKHLSSFYLNKIRLSPEIEKLRHKLALSLDEEAEEALETLSNEAPFLQGHEYLNKDCLQQYLENLHDFFQKALQKHKGSVKDFFHQYSLDVHLIGKIYFHLVENNKDPDYPFAFLATYAHKMDKEGRSQHRPLKFALTEYGEDQHKMIELLTTVHKASENSPFIKNLLDSGDIFHPLSWSSTDAYHFLKELDIYENAGILCRIPNWWKKKNKHVKLNISFGNKQTSLLGMNSLLDFKATLAIENEALTQEEIEFLLKQTEGLFLIKGKWISVDKKDLKDTLDSWKKIKKLMEGNKISFSEAFQYIMFPDRLKELGLLETGNIQLSYGDWLKSTLEKIQNPELVREIKVPSNFKAMLRPYQQAGLNWLATLHSLKLGACLADDMGLGKTIQLLAFLLTLKNQNKNKKDTFPNLLILPTSLIANWVSEINKFSPDLKYLVLHVSYENLKSFNQKKEEEKGKEIDSYDLIITTYGLARRLDWIKNQQWNYVILDEAQAIKNPNADQTKEIKKIPSSNRLILTGTPVENRLGDLWSLFDFLNPGLLGNYQEFAKYTKSLENKNKSYSSLRKIISPYILRRLKTDKKIINDLPDKIELDTFSNLSKKQIVLYQELVDKIKIELQEAEGIKRKGLILSSLLKFKQICNHPDQYLGQGSFEEEFSGKFIRLKELCETIFEKREKALIFTQFREITDPLHRYLAKIFGQEGLILHGGTPIKKRKEYVEAFQDSNYIPYFILSVKAGGTGLNLTAANHVIHFDRWWNPATENQATDRAFRIGQKSKVIVHKFITQGTIEEKIAQIIEEKKILSTNLIDSASNSWITEMSNKEFIDLIKIDSPLI